MTDSRTRRLSQRAMELRAFRKLLERSSVDLRGKHLLDACCGNGFGLELLAKAFRPARLVGFDPLLAQIERARRRGLAAELSVGDMTAIAQPDASFDGVFVSGPHFEDAARRATALGELARVLKPGGVLLVAELPVSAVREVTGAGLIALGDAKPFGTAICSFAAVKR